MVQYLGAVPDPLLAVTQKALPKLMVFQGLIQMPRPLSGCYEGNTTLGIPFDVPHKERCTLSQPAVPDDWGQAPPDRKSVV